MPSRAAMKRFSSSTSGGGASSEPSSAPARTRHCTSATRAAVSNASTWASIARTSRVPRCGCRRRSHQTNVWSGIAPAPISASSASTYWPYEANARGRPVRGNAPNTNVRADARPLSRPRQNGEFAARPMRSGTAARRLL